MKKLILLGALSVLLFSALGNAAGNGDPEEEMQKAGINALGGKAPAASEREPTEAALAALAEAALAEEAQQEALEVANERRLQAIWKQAYDKRDQVLTRSGFSKAERDAAWEEASATFAEVRDEREMARAVKEIDAAVLRRAVREAAEPAPPAPPAPARAEAAPPAYADWLRMREAQPAQEAVPSAPPEAALAEAALAEEAQQEALEVENEERRLEAIEKQAYDKRNQVLTRGGFSQAERIAAFEEASATFAEVRDEREMARAVKEIDAAVLRRAVREAAEPVPSAPPEEEVG